MEHWWNHRDKGQPKYLEKNRDQCHVVYNKSQIYWHDVTLIMGLTGSGGVDLVLLTRDREKWQAFVNLIMISYVYWTVHHLDSWVKRDQLDVTCFIISLFNAQHVSDVNSSILRSLRLMCCVISWVVLIWFDVIEPEQYNPRSNSTYKSQAPEDGWINIRNMLSIK